ncbi:hypothetical protein D0866_05609 [Hortaea werneckii]|uniref:Peroxisomal membrane protein PEX14 n=2 Tax=Hortaea werneckii TaxID=91943 RepID=A0A3M7B2D3_HORWE|nr:hypothetical protein D0866_05609 [Hortaea werneckii]
MADGKGKSSIPAWQRSRQQQAPPSPATADEASKPSDQHSGPEDSTSSGEETRNTHEDAMEAEEVAPPPEGTSQLDMVEAFLADPGVKDAPLEKKRRFLESKEIPVETIDKVLKPKEEEPSTRSPIDTGDFQAFRSSQATQQPMQEAPEPTQQPRVQTERPPPIITYPEFLVDAHKPPPLITPGRIINAGYVAAGLATLAYGASKFLVNPMIGSLVESRQDFATHTNSKLDEFNERLSKIVSRVPEPATKAKGADAATSEEEVDDTDSLASDPTELFHRDQGTQTSPPPSGTSTPATGDLVTPDDPTKKDAIAYHTNALNILSSHLSEISSSPGADEAVKARQEALSKLRHYLDTTMYASSSVNLWTQSEDGISAQSGRGQNGGKNGKKVDAGEELKKEVRGVKGVLLSARRFPGPGSAGVSMARRGWSGA